jgi:hypothetical protein
MLAFKARSCVCIAVACTAALDALTRPIVPLTLLSKVRNSSVLRPRLLNFSEAWIDVVVIEAPV